MTFASVYIDESGSHASSPLLCLAGFLYEREHAELLDKGWRAILEREKLPYMRMSEFKDGHYGPFTHLSAEHRDKLEREFIALIKQHRTLAFASAVNERMFNDVYKKHESLPMDAYGWCLLDCQKMIRRWADAHRWRGKIAYYFEAGHASQGTAHAGMTFIASRPSSRLANRYAQHTFADKCEVAPLQSADLLAWLMAKWFNRGFPHPAAMRKDLVALLTCEHHQRISCHLWQESALVKAINDQPDVIALFSSPGRSV